LYYYYFEFTNGTNKGNKMKLEKSIIIHATEDAKKKWEGKEKPIRKRKTSCPSCEIKKFEVHNGEVIDDE
jgi:hypothetical protein